MAIFRQFTANYIPMKPYAFWKELAMEAYLLENEEILKLDEQNFSEVDVLDAEIALKSGRKTGDGRIDILAKYGGEYLGIVEIKLHEINAFSLHPMEPGKYQKLYRTGKEVGLDVRGEIDSSYYLTTQKLIFLKSKKQ